MRVMMMVAALASSSAASAQEVRATITLADGWTFHQGDVPGLPGGNAPSEGWIPVSVPHTWNRVGHYIPDPQSHINRAETVNKYQGVAWYRLDLAAPAAFAGKRAWLQFDAASRIAEIWLNGRRLGEHRGSFSRFRVDATAALKPGQSNVLLVRVDSTNPSPKAATADTLPLAGDFFIHGGLYRPVSLIATDAVHIDMLDAGGPGVYATTRSLGKEQAVVDVRALLRNDGARAARGTVRLRLLDAAGVTVAEQTRPFTLAGSAGATVTAALTVKNPRPWNGTADPYLHRLVVDVLSRDGAALDSVGQAFGIRRFRVDPNRGFFLNGEPLKLRGVGYHQDREGTGTAVTPQDIETDVAIIREMGANTIRLTHYQHGQAIHDLADKHGLILWDEIPLVSVWTLGSAKEPTLALKENARQQLRELIRQNYNHPSVVTWGIANEVDFGNSLPMFLAGNKDGSTPPDPMPLLRELNALAKAEDPSRPTTLATCCEGRVFAPGVEVPITAAAADLGGANRYFGWYFGKPEDLGGHLDVLHATRPDQPLSVTEYGAGGATTIHTDDVLGGPVDSRGRNQPEEYESYIHEQNWGTLAGKPYLWATWLWNAFDFATTIRREGDANDINTKGLVTYDRKIRKDAYYFYKANWAQTPTVHITGRRYVDRAYAVTPVRVYSNAARTELVVNERSLGTLERCPQSTCVWPEVRLAPGTNRVVARSLDVANPAEDAVEWTVAPTVTQAFRIDSGAIVGAPLNGNRFGSDAFFEGGSAGTVDVVSDFGVVTKRPEIAGVADRANVASFREGTFGYRVPLADGHYRVTLTFVEPSAQPGARRFDVLANGKRKIANLDIAATAGGPLKALMRQFRVTVRGGYLDLRFAPSLGKAIVSAVEVAR